MNHVGTRVSREVQRKPFNYSWRKNPRTCRTKVKSGCLTCKIRHVKCDERKPDCGNCKSTGRKCDGYLPASNSKPPSVSSSLSNYDPAILQGTALEHQIFQFFQTCVFSDLSGLFISDFWDRYVRQLAVMEPSLYHATIALASLHHWYSTGNFFGSLKAETFISQQYRKAIHYLKNPTRPLSSVVVLIACYICCTFEILSGNFGSAFDHIDNGLRILSGNGCTVVTIYSRTSSTEDNDLRQLLVQHFARLDLMATTIEFERKSCFVGQDLSLFTSLTFSSLDDAQNLLLILIMEIFEYNKAETRLEDEGLSIIRTQLQTALCQWSEAMQNYLKHHPNLDAQQSRLSKLLKIHYLVAFIKLYIPGLADEVIWDEFTPQFETVISLASDILAGEPSGVAHFSIESEIVPALYLTGAKCRDPSVRHKAYDLLASCRRKEGLWDSVVAAKLLKCIIEIEEAGIVVRGCEDVPEHARLRARSSLVPSSPDHGILVVSFNRKLEKEEDGIDFELVEVNVDLKQ